MSCFLFLLPVAIAAGATHEPIPWQDRELPHEAKVRSVTVTSQSYRFTLEMGGCVDMDHAISRDSRGWSEGWQPNESVLIENLGEETIRNPKLIFNDRGDWNDAEGILRECLATARSEQEKVYLLWQFCRTRFYQEAPMFWGGYEDELHSPVKLFMTYGGGYCDDSAYAGASLFYSAGFQSPPPFVRILGRHVACEVFADQRWQFVDTNLDVFYLDRENEAPVGGDVVARDHDLAHRELHLGPLLEEGDWSLSQRIASLFGPDDTKEPRTAEETALDLELRPGERFEYRWDNIGKWASAKSKRKPAFVGNSRKIYEPSFENPPYGAVEAVGVASATRQGRWVIQAASAEGELLYRMTCAHVLCGGSLNAAFDLGRPVRSAVTIEAGFDPTALRRVWRSRGGGPQRAKVSLDKVIDPRRGKPKREFFVRVRFTSKAPPSPSFLSDLSIRADIMVNPLALPRLRLGENTATYTDDSPGDRKVGVTYRWRETAAAQPLPPPEAVYPPEGEPVRDPILTYRWNPVEGADSYHLQVSRDPQFRWPYRPSLDTILDATTYSVPFWGIYSPDTTYRYRLRSRNEFGIWSDWSHPKTFAWSGPRVPIQVEMNPQGPNFELSWKPNPRGPKPVSYEVYGSDFRGFSIHKQPYMLEDTGPIVANLVGRTTETRMLVAGEAVVEQTPPEVEFPQNLNRCYYRVVAFDEHGTPSGCSDYAESPNPYIWSNPPADAKFGVPYRYPLRCLHSLGHLQRRKKGSTGLLEKEILTYSLVDPPKWMSINGKTGVVTGVPPEDSIGVHSIRLRVTANLPERGTLDLPPDSFSPRVHEQTFSLKVTR